MKGFCHEIDIEYHTLHVSKGNVNKAAQCHQYIVQGLLFILCSVDPERGIFAACCPSSVVAAMCE